MPVLAIGGEEANGGVHGLQMKIVAADAAEIVLKDTGHWVLEERPKEHHRRTTEIFKRVNACLHLSHADLSANLAQRNQELAVRIALGASRAKVLWLVLKQGLEMAVIGVAIGLSAACATQRLISGILFGISPVDPATFVGGAALLLAVAAIASAIHGMRVMRIDPFEVLRQD